jgi:hypothetical protein
MHVGSLRRGWRLRTAMLATGLVATAVISGVGGSPAHAQKLQHTERFASQDEPIDHWTQYGPNGYPIGKDPVCPNYPGVHAFSKVWADAYGLDESLHASFRMQFHTQYDKGVAAAKVAMENAGLPVTCAGLGLYGWRHADPVPAMTWIACANATRRPARFCQLAANQADPAVHPNIDDRCGNATAPPAMWHEWHNLRDRVGDAAHLYDIDVLGELAGWLKGIGPNMPVYLDDVTIVGGVKNFDQASATPTWGNQWYGYGRVVSPTAANVIAQWYDDAAVNLGRDPFTNPVTAHNAVDAAIAAGKAPKGSYGLTRADFYKRVACPYAPKIKDVVDPGNVATFAAIGQDISRWVYQETGQTLCQRIHSVPKFANLTGAVCHNELVGILFDVVDNGRCMNLPDNGVAVLLGKNLGCNRDIHLARMFAEMKEMLGG